MAKSKLGTRSKKPTKKERPDDSDETRARRRRGRAVRARGSSFEREVAEKLRGVFPNVRRLLENHKDDANGVDLLHTGLYRIQCKRMARYAPLTNIEQVTADEELMGEVPVLITKGDQKRILVALPLEEFVRLLRKSLC
jgi:hypothetical protein